MKTTLVGICCVLIGFGAAWYLNGQEIAACQSELVTQKRIIEEQWNDRTALQQEHAAMAERLIAKGKELNLTYTELATYMAKGVDLTIPAKKASEYAVRMPTMWDGGAVGYKAEWKSSVTSGNVLPEPVLSGQASKVQVETNEIAGLAKMIAKFEAALKLATKAK